MPCLIKCLELPAQVTSNGFATQKVAVKLPAQATGSTDADFGQFADIMAALMQLPTDQLNQSLEEQFAWVSLDGEAKEWLPLIDLSKTAGENSDMLQMLLNGSMGQNSLQPTDTLKAIRQMTLQGTIATKQNADVLPVDLDGAKNAEAEAFIGVGSSKDVQASDLTGNKQSQSIDVIALKQDETLDQKLTAKVALETRTDTPIKPADPSGADQNGAKHGSGQDQEKAVAQFNQPLKKLSTGTLQTTSGETTPAGNQKAEGQTGANSHIEKSLADLDSQTTESKPDMNKAISTAMEKQHSEGKLDSKVGTSAEAAVKNDTNTMLFNSSNQTTSPISDGSAKNASIHTATTEQPHTTQDTPVESKTLQNDVIRQIVQRMTLQSNGRQSQMNIQLKPEFLGNLRLEVVTENHQVMVRMAAENHAVREMIEHNIHVLKNELEQHGLQVQKVDVYVAQNGDQWKNGRRFQHSHQRGGQNKGRNREGADTVEMSGGRALAGNEQVERRSANRSEVDFFA